MALVDNTIENNGEKAGTAGIRVRGITRDLVFQNNIIRDTRENQSQTQTVGVLIEEGVGNVTLDGNSIDAQRPLEDRRKPAGNNESPQP